MCIRDRYYPDGTYIAHSNIAYNGGYGYTALSESCHLVYMLTDTPWEIMDEKAKNVFQWIYDSYETIIYNGVLMDAFRGREIARTDMKQADAAIIVVKMCIRDRRNRHTGPFAQCALDMYAVSLSVTELDALSDVEQPKALLLIQHTAFTHPPVDFVHLFLGHPRAVIPHSKEQVPLHRFSCNINRCLLYTSVWGRSPVF